MTHLIHRLHSNLVLLASNIALSRRKLVIAICKMQVRIYERLDNNEAVKLWADRVRDLEIAHFVDSARWRRRYEAARYAGINYNEPVKEGDITIE